MATNKSGIALLAEGAEEIEFVVPVDVLRRAGIDLKIAGVDGKGNVTGMKGIIICPDISLSDATSQDYDVIFLPGGLNAVRKFEASQKVGELLKKQDSRGGIIAAICAGPLALKTHEIGKGKNITSDPKVKDELVSGGNYKYSDDKVVVDGNMITSRGPGTVFDFAFTIVEKVFSKEKRSELAKELMCDDQ